MSNPPAFQLYASDFYMDTASWSPNDVGIYTRLLMYEWVNGGVPDNIREMARIAGCDPKTMEKSWSLCTGKKFSINGLGKWENSRLEKTRKEQQEYREKLANSGRLGGLKTQEKARQESSKASSKASSKNKALQSSSSPSPFRTKEIKNLYLDFVMLSVEEHGKLIAELGEGKTADMISRLNVYLGSTGKKYKSHYFTILNWERKDKENDNGKPQGSYRKGNTENSPPSTKYAHLGRTINLDD